MRKLQKALMTGVSYMLPFIVVAGLSIATSGILQQYFNASQALVGQLNSFGWNVMGFIPPIFAAYVAFAIADKAGIAPGFIGGWLAANPVLEGTSASGFLGALIAGIAAGYLVLAMKNWKFPEVIASLKSTLVIPLLSSWIIFLLMAYPVGIVTGALNDAIIGALLTMVGNTASAIALGAILSAMCAFDMGGPLNKIAITFVFAVWADPSGFGFMANAAVFPGIMVPSLSVGLASIIAKNKFTESEKKMSTTAIVSGLVGITEATLPYAFRDPIRVIGSNIIGAAVGGALVMANGISCSGVSGIIGFPAADKPLLFILSIAAGVVVSTTLLVLTKKVYVEEEETAANEDFELEIEF